MTATIFAAVIAAAFMHASWNVLVKLKLDRFLSLFLLQSLMGAFGIVMLAAFGAPSQAALPYAFVSGLLHTGYNIFLARSYRDGSLSQVYPIARGAAPLLTLMATLVIAHDALRPMTILGICGLIGGILLIAVDRRAAARLDRHSLYFALGTSLFIAAYTVFDGFGGRASGNPSGYAGLVFLLDALFLASYAVWRRGLRVFADVLPSWRMGVAGAALSAGAYWIVIWAMTEAPIAAVAALRETSILFVMLMSARILKEDLGWTRYAGGALVVVGAAAMRLA
jgi:drug/metabolite transporter (DMT)-like permease